MHDHHSPGRRELLLVTPPAGLPISLVQAKQQLRIEHDDDDDYITGILIPAAVAYLDPGGGGNLGRALVRQQWQLSLDRFPGGGVWPLYDEAPYSRGISDRLAIHLDYPPLISVDTVQYVDQSGAPQTLAPSAYQVTGIGTRQKARLAPPPGQTWPITLVGELDAVQVTYTCGHAPSDDTPPDYGANVEPAIRHAMLLMISHLYENRDAVVVSDRRGLVTALPLGFDALLANHRVQF